MIALFDPPPWWLVVAGWSVVVAVWHTSVVALGFATWRLWRHAASARRHYIVASGALALAAALTVATPFALLTQRSAGPPTSPAPDSDRLVSPGAIRSSTIGVSASSAWRVSIGRVIGRTAPWIGAFWCVGVAVGLVRFGGGWALARLIRRRATALRSPVVAAAAAAARAAWGLPSAALLSSTHVEAPVVVGARAPAVLLPLDLEQSLGAGALMPLLAHELAHVARGDYAANLLQSLVDTLLFFSPGARWLSRCVRDAREYCCDDLVAARCGTSAYVSALTTLARLGVATRARPAVNAAGPRLIVRIRRLLHEDAMPPFARYRLSALIASVALVVAAGVDVMPVSAVAIAQANADRPAAPGAMRRSGNMSMGFLTLQPGAALRLRSMQSTDAGLCGTAEIENLGTVTITGVRFVSFVHGPAPLERTTMTVGGVGTSDMLPVDLAPGQLATVDVALLTEAQARETLRTPFAQIMCGVAEVRYANGGRWGMPPATVLGPERADIPRAMIGRASIPGEAFCRDDGGGEYSAGAVIPVRSEPQAFARCTGGTWSDFQLSALSSGRPFVRMDFVLPTGHRPQIGVEPGTMARFGVGASTWGIRPTVDQADERRVRLEIDDLTVDPAVRVADFWTTVGAPPVDVPKASFAMSVRATRTP